MSKAFALLDLPVTATPEEIKAKWRDLAMVHHPDHGGNPCTFDELRKAYKAALEEASQPKICPECKGQRKILQGHGFNTISMPCKTCGGLGTI